MRVRPPDVVVAVTDAQEGREGREGRRGRQPIDAATVDRILGLDAPVRFDRRELARRSGMTAELTARFWRALGFPDVPDDEKAFTDADVDALAVTSAMLRRGIVDPAVALQVTRLMASSLARVAEVYVEIPRERARHGGSGDALDFDAETLRRMPALLEYVWRRQLQAAARRVLLRADDEGPTATMTVGFADLVGFTARSQQLGDLELARLVDRFSALTHDTVAALGGRLVKVIGDEVMFVVEDPAAGVEVALRLAEAHARDPELSDVRVGLAAGPVLPREGDYYGPVVNLASRVVTLADPGSVVVPDGMRSALAGAARDWRDLGEHDLKGIGPVRLWAVGR